MSKRILFIILFILICILAWAFGGQKAIVKLVADRSLKTQTIQTVAPPSVSVSRVHQADFVERVLVTGSLVPREEVLVAPEVEGLRILEIRVEQGDTVKKGDILAVLETETLDAQLAQNAASLERSNAAIAQSKSQISEVEARLEEANSSLNRAKALTQSGYLSASVLDQRMASMRSLTALQEAARNGLKAAEADKVHMEGLRRELEWRRSRTEVRAPVSGMITRRTARLGKIATAIGVAAGEPMFRIIQNGEVELDAEVGEADLPKIANGQPTTINVAGGVLTSGKVRLISPEVDSATRLGRVRIFIGSDPRLRIGTFASGMIETAHKHNLAIPVSAVNTSSGISTTLVLDGSIVRSRIIEVGLTSDGLIEVRKGLSEGEVVITRAGTFLKDGDAVRAIEQNSDTVSQVQ